jgi:aminocarboxymuconate-semialdehyde decarboxylase
VDSLIHDTNFLKYVIDLIGEDKICCGSDYPFPLGEAVPGEEILALNVSGKIKEKLLYKNALDWLQLEEKKFLLK